MDFIAYVESLTADNCKSIPVYFKNDFLSGDKKVNKGVRYLIKDLKQSNSMIVFKLVKYITQYNKEVVPTVVENSEYALFNEFIDWDMTINLKKGAKPGVKKSSNNVTSTKDMGVSTSSYKSVILDYDKKIKLLKKGGTIINFTTEASKHYGRGSLVLGQCKVKGDVIKLYVKHIDGNVYDGGSIDLLEFDKQVDWESNHGLLNSK